LSNYSFTPVYTGNFLTAGIFNEVITAINEIYTAKGETSQIMEEIRGGVQGLSQGVIWEVKAKYFEGTGSIRDALNKLTIEYIGEVYLAQDDDFVKINGRWVYRGSELEIEIPHKIQGEEITSYDYMFYGTGSYLATPVTRVDSNNKMVTNMSYMFCGSSATTLDLSSFDTSKVTNMSSMFRGSSATTLDLSSFDTSNVTDMRYMFRGSSATTLDLSSFDTSNVTNMSYMFDGSSATILDLSSFDTSKVTNMGDMFRNSSATTLDLSSFDTSNVTNMSYMFCGSSATTLDLSSFDTSNVTDMSGMFYNSSATTLDLSSFDTSNVTNMSYMFCGSSATTLDLSSFDTSNVTNMSYMFRGSSATTGYARTQEDADRFNNSSNKPSALVFVVK
jgi:surface protein